MQKLGRSRNLADGCPSDNRNILNQLSLFNEQSLLLFMSNLENIIRAGH